MHPVCDSVGTLVVMPRDEGPQDHAGNEFLQGLLPLSSSTSGASTRTSTPRDQVRGSCRRGSSTWPQFHSLTFGWRIGNEPPSTRNKKADDARAESATTRTPSNHIRLGPWGSFAYRGQSALLSSASTTTAGARSAGEHRAGCFKRHAARPPPHGVAFHAGQQHCSAP